MTAPIIPTKVVSVVSVPGGRGYHAPAIYELIARADGVETYRRVGMPLGTRVFQGRCLFVGNRSARVAERRAEEIAETQGLPFVSGVRHGSRPAGLVFPV